MIVSGYHQGTASYSIQFYVDTAAALKAQGNSSVAQSTKQQHAVSMAQRPLKPGKKRSCIAQLALDQITPRQINEPAHQGNTKKLQLSSCCEEYSPVQGHLVSFMSHHL